MREWNAVGSLVVFWLVLGCGQSSRTTTRAADAGEGGTTAGAGSGAGGNTGVGGGGTGTGGSGIASGNGGVGMGGSGDAAGMSGDGGDGGEVECQDRTPPSCNGCPSCFTLSDEYSVCGTDVQPEAAVVCSADAMSPFTSDGLDECACEGKTCGDGKTCVLVTYGVSGGAQSTNRCFELCVIDSDCGAGRACLPSRYTFSVCAEPECLSDADCTEDPCGHCIAPQVLGFQGGYRSGIPKCIYDGPGDGACEQPRAGCDPNECVGSIREDVWSDQLLFLTAHVCHRSPVY